MMASTVSELRPASAWLTLARGNRHAHPFCVSLSREAKGNGRILSMIMKIQNFRPSWRYVDGVLKQNFSLLQVKIAEEAKVLCEGPVIVVWQIWLEISSDLIIECAEQSSIRTSLLGSNSC